MVGRSPHGLLGGAAGWGGGRGGKEGKGRGGGVSAFLPPSPLPSAPLPPLPHPPPTLTADRDSGWRVECCPGRVDAGGPDGGSPRLVSNRFHKPPLRLPSNLPSNLPSKSPSPVVALKAYLLSGLYNRTTASFEPTLGVPNGY